MSGTYAPLAPLSPNNQGAADIIVAYFLIAATVIFSSVRFAVGRQRLLQLDFDDACFGGALIFGIATSVVSHVEVTAGLGRHQSNLSQHDVEKYFKLSYVDQFLAVIAMTLAKCSILLLFRRIMSKSQLMKAIVTLSTMIGVYFVFSIFATAFQCGLPKPWWLEPATCPTHGRLLYAIIGMNMITDGALAVWIIPSLWKLQMENKSRAVVASLFGARFIVVGVAIGQIVLTEKSLRSADQTWAALPRTIIDQVVVHASIIHATLPRIHGFLIKLPSGSLNIHTTTDIPLSQSKDRKGSGRRTGSNRSTKLSLTSITGGKSRKVNNQLYISSSSHDYAHFDEKAEDDSKENTDGNIINGMRLRPDIMPGSKWSTTIYADPAAPQPSDGRNQRSRQHSASTKDERDMPMGGRVDDETSTSSLTERRDHYAADPDVISAVNSVSGQQEQAQRIWKTKEFRMQIERVRGDGSKLDVTKRENMVRSIENGDQA